jgi:CheY-like chemotaxis protein/AraC-like DNA-binding protein
VTAEHAVGALETEVETPGEPREDRTTVLVVDDNPDVRVYVRSVLAGAYRVLEAADGAEALVVARAALPDLIVADVMMPELDGLGLGRALKADAMTDAIPVVLLTARAAPEDQVAGLGTGADAYLVKPFDPAVLEATVAGLLAQRRRLRVRFGRRAVEAPTEAPVEALGEVLGGAPVAALPVGGVPVGEVPAEAPAAPAAGTLADPVPAAPSALEGRLRALVVARLTDDTLSPEALAAAAGLSYHQLYRGLRDELHTTPSRFIRGVRVECAAELLRQNAGSVTEVAYAVGFASLSYFSRAFQERFGVAPSTFRHEAGGPD